MNLQSIININVDFYNKKYILINAKQLDKGSRFLLVTCYNHGIPFSLDYASQSAYIRYKKADDYSVFNLCQINSDGKILVELTEQMLATAGICTADLVIINKRDVKIDEDTLEVTVENAEILSTMTFLIDVSEVAADNSEIESSYEYNGLNETLAEANAEYSNVIKWARSYATGDGGVRYNEETDNAKYYNQLSRSYAIGDADGVRNNENTDNAKYYSEQSSNSANQSESYAIGGTGTRTGENTDNAKYYYQVVKDIVNGLNSGFIPMGTITFAELETAEKAVGFTYNISDDFVTDDNFAEGAGKQYTAGTNVYCRYDGLWDAFGGAASPTATIDEVKEYLGI